MMIENNQSFQKWSGKPKDPGERWLIVLSSLDRQWFSGALSELGGGCRNCGTVVPSWSMEAFFFPLSFSPLFLPPQLLGPTGTANRAARNAGNSSRVGACVKQTSEQMLTKKNVLWKPFLLLLFRCDDHSKDLGQMCERNSDTENTGYEKERSRKAMGRRCFYKRAFCIPAVNCLSFKSCFWEQQLTFFSFLFCWDLVGCHTERRSSI